MRSSGRPVLILITTPDRQSADRIAHELVRLKLAAGVQLTSIESVYWWDGKINQREEVVLTVKTIAGNFDAVEAVVDDLHPYDVPPVIQIGIEAGKKTYLDWMTANAVGKH